MSLATLVAFAQENFGVLSGIPGETALEASLGTEAPPPRPPLPDWFRGRRPDQDIPAGAGHVWKIDGPLDPQRPPLDVDRIGPDALAFYVPFHFYRNGWGVFIRMSGVVYLASVLKGGTLRPGDEPYLSVAEAVLLEHELIHAAAEIVCTRAELLARSALYRPYFESTPAAHHEEALANAYAVRRCLDDSDPLAVKPTLERWMTRQGEGYRDFGRWLTAQAFSRGQERAARFIVAPLPSPLPKSSTSLHTFLFRGARAYPSMPVVRVNDLGASAASLLKPFPKAHGILILVHTNDHLPPHIHIQVPPGGAETRYHWPQLLPLRGEKALTGATKKSLDKYLGTYYKQIDARVRAVYGSHAV